MLEREQLEQAIAGQEALRATLGDIVVDATIAILREKLAHTGLHDSPEQRKLVTILFADTVASTAMGERLDPEDTLEIFNGALEAYTDAVSEMGGTVARLMGDGLLAFFGAPIGREDDPVRAVRCGLAIIRAAKQYARQVEERWGISSFNARVGINTGLVALGEVGGAAGSEWTAMGDAINLASRVEQNAPVGSVLISHDTYRHVRGLFETRRLEPIQVKGKTERLQVYVIEREKPRTFRASGRGVEGVETPMIGRSDELQQLQEIFSWAVEENETQVITIMGEPGVGKSRLLREFDTWLDELAESILHFTGRATAEMVNLPYALMRNVFAFRFQIHDSDNAATLREKLERGVAGFMGEDSARKAHYIGHLIGFDFSNSPYLQGEDPQHLTQMGLYYLTEFFGAAASDMPTVLFLEDIHWADDKSLDLINHIVRSKRGLKLLIVCLARPALFERRPPLWTERHEFHTYVELRPLTRKDTRKLACDILCQLDDIPGELLDRIVNTADGNPFYVEELIKMMLDDGVLLNEGKRWRVETGRLSSLKIPPTLTGVLQARLDTLSPEERTVLQRASVVGRIFWDSAVAQLQADGEQMPGNTRESLNRLRRRELIRGREQSAFDGAKEYIFNHTILRDVTYESVLRRQRRVYHSQIADWLVERSGDRINEFIGLIAEHYERAGQADKALMYLQRAAEQALSISAYREAISLLEKALGVVKDEQNLENAIRHEAQLKLLLGQGYRGLSAFAKASELYAGSLERFREIEDNEGIVRALYELGWLNGYIMRHYDEGERYMQESLSIARSIGDKKGISWALNGMGVLAHWRGWFSEAIRCYEESLALAREIGDQARVAGALNNIGLVKSELGLYDEAQAYLEEGRQIMEATGRRAGIFSSFINIGRLAQRRGHHEEARRLFSEAMVIGKEIGDRSSVASGLWTLGNLARLEGDYEEARRYFHESLSVSKEINFPSGIGSCLQSLSLVARLQGDYDQARLHLEESLKLARAMEDQTEIANALMQVGGIAHLQGDTVEARKLLEESVILNMNMGNQRGVARGLYLMGGVTLTQGQTKEARKFFTDSLAIEREFDHQSGITLGLSGLGDTALAEGDVSAAQAAFSEAYTQAAEIRDTPLTLWVLAGLAGALAEAGEDARSSELLGLVLHHHASPQEARDRAATIQANVLPLNAATTAAFARGQAMAQNAPRGQVGLENGHWLMREISSPDNL